MGVCLSRVIIISQEFETHAVVHFLTKIVSVRVLRLICLFTCMCDCIYMYICRKSADNLLAIVCGLFRLASVVHIDTFVFQKITVESSCQQMHEQCLQYKHYTCASWENAYIAWPYMENLTPTLSRVYIADHALDVVTGQ